MEDRISEKQSKDPLKNRWQIRLWIVKTISPKAIYKYFEDNLLKNQIRRRRKSIWKPVEISLENLKPGNWRSADSYLKILKNRGRFRSIPTFGQAFLHKPAEISLAFLHCLRNPRRNLNPGGQIVENRRKIDKNAHFAVVFVCFDVSFRRESNPPQNHLTQNPVENCRNRRKIPLKIVGIGRKLIENCRNRTKPRENLISKSESIPSPNISVKTNIRKKEKRRQKKRPAKFP